VINFVPSVKWSEKFDVAKIESNGLDAHELFKVKSVYLLQMKGVNVVNSTS
jgi:hypothetical protein